MTNDDVAVERIDHGAYRLTPAGSARRYYLLARLAQATAHDGRGWLLADHNGDALARFQHHGEAVQHVRTLHAS